MGLRLQDALDHLGDTEIAVAEIEAPGPVPRDLAAGQSLFGAGRRVGRGGHHRPGVEAEGGRRAHQNPVERAVLVCAGVEAAADVGMGAQGDLGAVQPQHPKPAPQPAPEPAPDLRGLGVQRGAEQVGASRVKVGNRRQERVVVIQPLENHAPQGDRGSEQSVVVVMPRLLQRRLQVRLPEQAFENPQAPADGKRPPPFCGGGTSGIRFVARAPIAPHSIRSVLAHPSLEPPALRTHSELLRRSSLCYY